MRLWTIQHQAAYEKMLKTGSLRADEEHLFCGTDFRYAYDWIAGQMSKRIGAPPEKVNYPVWLWYQWEGVHKRPNMRGSHRYYSPKGTPIVLLTVDVPDNFVLLSDFDMWNTVLNNEYLAVDMADDEGFCRNQDDIEKSWDRIFDIDADYEYYSAAGEKSIQATMWEIKAEWGKRAEFFKSL